MGTIPTHSSNGSTLKKHYKLDAQALKRKFNLVDYVKSTREHWEPTMKGVMTHCVSSAHNDSTPSMLVTPDSWYCFGCRRHGDSVSFIMEDAKVDFLGALSIMSGEAYAVQELSLPPRYENTVVPPSVELIELYHSILKNNSKEGYLTERGLTLETIERFHLGYGTPRRTRRFVTPRYVIPVFDSDGNPVTIRYRLDPSMASSGEPKYITLPRTRSYLFNTQTIKGADFVVYVGGQIDAMLLEQFGFHSVGSAGETTFRKEWGEIFGDTPTVILLDNDEAGMYGSIAAWLSIKNAVIAKWPPYFPDKYDINDAIQDPSFGVDGLRRLIYDHVVV